MNSDSPHKYKTLTSVLEHLSQSFTKTPAVSIVGSETITKHFLRKLDKRLKVTNKKNHISNNYFKLSIQDYETRNELSPESKKLLLEHRFYIYINHFLRVFQNLYNDKKFYDLEYITDDTHNINILNKKIFDIVSIIIRNRLAINKLPFDSPIVSRLLVHGQPLDEIFVVPDNLIICYSVPITYFGLMNLDLLKLYEFIAKKYANYIACLDVLQSETHNSKYLQFFYPGQQIWNIKMGKDTTSDKENYGEFLYDPRTEKFGKKNTTDHFFDKYDDKKLSDYCVGKKGILFVDACRACNAGYNLGSQSVEFMCMYETLLKILNNIISEQIIKTLDPKVSNYENITKELESIGTIDKTKLMDKKILVDVNSQLIYDIVEIEAGHRPFFDPFLSPNFDNSDTKRIYFNTEYSELSPTNPQKKSGNEANIKQKIEKIPKSELFGENITRNSILTLILNAISFHNNANNIKYLCDMLLTDENINLITLMLDDDNNNLITYLFKSEYYIYGLYLLIYYSYKPTTRGIDYNIFNILNTKQITEEDVKNVKKILTIDIEWDNFFEIINKIITELYESNITKIANNFYILYTTIDVKLSHRIIRECNDLVDDLERDKKISIKHGELNGGKNIVFKTLKIKTRQIKLKKTIKK